MVNELLRRDKEAGAAPDATYMAMVGSLLYVAMVSRPDIALAVQVLGRSLQASTQEHITAAKRVMRYLKGTSHLTLQYGGKCEVPLRRRLRWRQADPTLRHRPRLHAQRGSHLMGQQAAAHRGPLHCRGRVHESMCWDS